jgi:hypothetical protein
MSLERVCPAVQRRIPIPASRSILGPVEITTKSLARRVPLILKTAFGELFSFGFLKDGSVAELFLASFSPNQVFTFAFLVDTLCHHLSDSTRFDLLFSLLSGLIQTL